MREVPRVCPEGAGVLEVAARVRRMCGAPGARFSRDACAACAPRNACVLGRAAMRTIHVLRWAQPAPRWAASMNCVESCNVPILCARASGCRPRASWRETGASTSLSPTSPPRIAMHHRRAGPRHTRPKRPGPATAFLETRGTSHATERWGRVVCVLTVCRCAGGACWEAAREEVRIPDAAVVCGTC